MYNKENFDFGDSVFIPMADFGEVSRHSACADYDGNGYNDIATIRYLHAPIINLNILFNDGNGNFLENPITDITYNLKPQTQNLKCYPNPFKNEATISVSIQENERTILQIYDLNGKLIQSIINKELKKGNYRFKWNGTDKNGKEVKTGVYIIWLVTGRQNQMCRAIYLE